jgi:pyruvate dehydrogenase E1 component alpha subunit
MREDLVARGLLSEARAEEIRAGAEAEVDDAVRYAEESPFPPAEELYRDVYAPDGPELVAGRRQ